MLQTKKLMFISDDENMRDFSLDTIEILEESENTLVVRTSDLFPTLFHLQKCWWKLWELLPDDEDGVEYNILTYYKPKKWS